MLGDFHVGDLLATLIAAAESARPSIEDRMLRLAWVRDGVPVTGWELESYLLSSLWVDYGYIGTPRKV